MLASIISLFLFSLYYVLVQCEMPNLSVRKMDKSLIAKKRQDTRDMCRIFTEENAKIQHDHPKIIQSYKPVRNSHNRRRKREVDMKYPVNPALNEEDARRVEKIVEKLYDDMEEKGEKVTYRQNIFLTTVATTTAKKPKNASAKPSRRFFFAPNLERGAESTGLSTSNPTSTTTAAIYEEARWKHGIVPYFIDSKTYDAQLQESIMKAFDYIEKTTCVRLQKLRERPTDKRSLQEVGWVYISNPLGIRQCVHSNEKLKVDGVQMSVLGYDCMSVGDIVHEVMHILGFSHEHLRSDRDQHISILWDNIKPGYRKYFEISKVMDQYSLEHLPYDHASVLHYPARAFSKNGQATILTTPGIKIGQREGLSEIDVEKVGAIYSSECVERNRDYLLKTCPGVVKAESATENITQKDIDDYFKQRIWPYGLINYKLRDTLEFSTEERENIKAVIRHIEQETCIQFKDIGAESIENESEHDNDILKDDDKSVDVDKYTASPPPDKDYKNGNAEIIFLDVNSKSQELMAAEPSKNVSENETKNTNHQNEKQNDDNKSIDIAKYTARLPTEENSKNGFAEIIFLDVNSESQEIMASKNVSENEIKTADYQGEQQNNEMIDIMPLTDQRLDIETKAKMNTKATSKRTQAKKVRRNLRSHKKGTRRHAENIMMLTRSPMPGCKCPKPGKPNGNTVLEINADCFNSVNDLLHLFVHVLGLDHQHNMHDRDAYLHIMWDNLTPDIKKELIGKLPPAASLGFPYDYQSVMHYPWLQIKDGVTNMMYPIWNDGWAMGHWQGLSSLDVKKLNILYFSQCLERQEQAFADNLA